MLNKIILMGRLGRDPEVRYTQSGKPVASFSLAVDRDFKDKASGERATDWIDVVAWDAKAKFVQQYFHKGQQAAEVVADNIYFAGAKAAAPSEGNAPEESLPPEPGESFSELEDEGEQHEVTVDERCEYDDLYFSKCGKQSPDNFLNFCGYCGAPMTDEAVEMVIERLEEFHGQENP